MTNVLIQDSGFVEDDFGREIIDWEETSTPEWHGFKGYGLHVPNTVSAEELQPHFKGVSLIRIDFPNFTDGRGFSIARHLRLLGYSGRLRAFGHVIADQYTMARRCGFDEVEVDQSLATRQPLEDWQSRANWRAHNYLARMQQAV
ncbi:MAG: DUF934 domain-containing protein [Rhodobacteraceae bacterium]|nr:DUF934 domain-containing protein [Paracoccaceae bacterium]